jgi:hypothetical protein
MLVGMGAHYYFPIASQGSVEKSMIWIFPWKLAIGWTENVVVIC